jgi:hypothetical protein
MTMNLFDYYATHSAWTDPGRHARLFDNLPADVGELARIIQGLAIYDVVAEPFYGFKVPEPHGEEIHIRRVDEMLDRIVCLDDRPLAAARPVEKGW